MEIVIYGMGIVAIWLFFYLGYVLIRGDRDE